MNSRNCKSGCRGISYLVLLFTLVLSALIVRTANAQARASGSAPIATPSPMAPLPERNIYSSVALPAGADQALLSAFSDSPALSINQKIYVLSMDKHGDWAIGTVAVGTDLEKNGADPYATTLVALHRVNGQWEAALWGSSLYSALIAEFPSSAIPDRNKPYLLPSTKSDVTAADIPISLKLPWAAPQTWQLKQGPHPNNPSSTVKTALDFAPYSSPSNSNYVDPSHWYAVAAADGVVIRYCVGQNQAWVMIRHTTGGPTDYFTGYLHLSSNYLSVQTGSLIKQGGVIDVIYNGSTAPGELCGPYPVSSTGPHLHFNVGTMSSTSNTPTSVDIGGTVISGWTVSTTDNCLHKGSDRVCQGQDLTSDNQVCWTADVNRDGVVDIVDIGILIDNYGKHPIPYPRADVNKDGVVDIVDIGIAVDQYGLSGACPITASANLRSAVAQAGMALAPALGSNTASALTGDWIATGPMGTSRRSETVTLLPDGRVLAAGGNSDNPGTAELYDPTTGQWGTTGAMHAVRETGFTATLLATGKVLVVGGSDAGKNALDSAELYDPTSGTWTITGSLAHARSGHTATLLKNGKVLVVGGCGSLGAGCLASAELYDLATGLWTSTGSMSTSRFVHTATLLANGKVLVAGGYAPAGPLSSAELYDPSTGKWAKTGALRTGRVSHTATRLQNGLVLVAGGFNDSSRFIPSAELYNPATGTWSATRSLSTGRENPTATLLSTGKVLLSGGRNAYSGGNLASAELYNPATATWTLTPPMNAARSEYDAVLLRDGRVLVVGGNSPGGVLASAELYVPPIPLLITPTAADTLFVLRPGFDWTDMNGATKYNIQISRNAAFTDLVVNTVTIPSAYTPSADLPANRYLFWRVQAQVAGIWQGWSSTEKIKMPNPPTIPGPVSPCNNALVRNYRPVLDWNDSTVPVGTAFEQYLVELFDTPNLGSAPLVVGTPTDIHASSFTPGADLAPNSTFYWRVRATNLDDASSSWSKVCVFRTALTAPVPNNPPDLAVLPNKRPTFAWSPVNGATGYSLQVCKSQIFAGCSLALNVGTSATTYPTGIDLPAKTTLYWRVAANGANGPSAWSTPRSFTTGNPPSIPVLASPATTVLVRTYTPLLDWQNSLVPVGVTFDHYELQLATDAGFSQMVLNPSVPGPNTNSAYAVLGGNALLPNTRYFWRVRAFNTANDYSAWSLAWTFRTFISPPALVTPLDNSAAATRQPAFDWNDVPGATYYQIQISRVPNFGTVWWQASPAASTAVPPVNLPTGTLYWRVKAFGPNGPSNWSVVWKVTLP